MNRLRPIGTLAVALLLSLAVTDAQASDFVVLDVPESPATYPQDVNNKREVVGYNY